MSGHTVPAEPRRTEFVGEPGARPPLSPEELTAYDAEHVWHPYGAFPPSTRPLVVTSAEGVRLTLDDGRQLIDGMSSWWAAVHGYRHPRLDAALADQAARMSHVMFGGLTHAPAVELSRRLVDLTPEPLTRCSSLTRARSRSRWR